MSLDSSQEAKNERHNLYMATYECDTPDEIRQAYKNWAPVYECHIQDQGWAAPKLVSELLVQHLKNTDSVRVLDVGAGTGLVGVELQSLGVTNVDAFDISSDMLDLAVEKHTYQNIIVGNAEMMNNVSDNEYDCVICVGALNFGHISPKAFLEFIRVTKPNGLIAFSTRQDYYDKSSHDVQTQLCDEGKWQLVQKNVVGTAAVRDIGHIHWCYRVV